MLLETSPYACIREAVASGAQYFKLTRTRVDAHDVAPPHLPRSGWSARRPPRPFGADVVSELPYAHSSLVTRATPGKHWVLRAYEMNNQPSNAGRDVSEAPPGC